MYIEKNRIIFPFIFLLFATTTFSQTYTTDITVNGLTVGKGSGTGNVYNSAVGVSALKKNTTGNYNSAVGYQALSKNTVGASNTAFGFNSLTQLAAGSCNVAVGDWTCSYLYTGDYNTVIGSHISLDDNTSNTMAIGSYMGIRIYSPATGNLLLGSTTDNGLAKLQVNGSVMQTGVTNSLLKADANGVLIPAVAGTDYAAASGSANYLSKFNSNNVLSNSLVYDNGTNVGIGTANPQYKLAVNGDIGAKKIKVTQSNWSDYVFDSSYLLTPLMEVARYIKEFKHLPDVLSEKEVIANGIDLGENQAVLLKKIEELTLYGIEQEKSLAENKMKLEELSQLFLQMKIKVDRMEKRGTMKE